LIFNDYRAKADINGSWSSLKELINHIGWGVVGFRGEKAEAADIDMFSPVFWFGEQSRRPSKPLSVRRTNEEIYNTKDNQSFTINRRKVSPNEGVSLGR
jgi:hypothetical protein